MVTAEDMEVRKSVGKFRETGASKMAGGASEGSLPHRRDGDSAPPAACECTSRQDGLKKNLDSEASWA
jgi:hypothetical protein